MTSRPVSATRRRSTLLGNLAWHLLMCACAALATFALLLLCDGFRVRSGRPLIDWYWYIRTWQGLAMYALIGSIAEVLQQWKERTR